MLQLLAHLLHVATEVLPQNLVHRQVSVHAVDVGKGPQRPSKNQSVKPRKYSRNLISVFCDKLLHAHDQRTRGQVARERQPQAEDRGEGSRAPRDVRQSPHVPGEEEGDHGRNDQEAEHHEHARHRHGEGDHHAERQIEQEVPPAHLPPEPLGLLEVEGDGEEAVAQDVMEHAQRRVARCELDDRGLERDPQDTARQGLLDRFAAPRNLVGHENGGG